MPTWVACAACVCVDGSNGAATVEQPNLIVDAGTVVHPDSTLAQVEGAALSVGVEHGPARRIGVRERSAKNTNLDTYTSLRIGDVPEVQVEFVACTEAPVGLGGPATTVVAPAIGNAIFAATGRRVRRLPIRPEAVHRALTTPAAGAYHRGLSRRPCHAD